jgi:glycosyltransferase involved in cell wall biosynthesis
MSRSSSPFVSVVIPVYNGQDVIANAIRSVLAQTYDNFELIIANNCSTDGTAAIAEEFARKDPRVRVCNATDFVNVVESHNRAFTLVSDDAAYCKILDSDDWLFPNCLTEMVNVAEAYPTIGMVASYVLRDNYVVFDGLPYGGSFWDGREICRRFLLDDVYVFGGPSSSLIRAKVLREKRPFYNPRIYHGDTDAYLDIMQRYDFGYVYQVLTFQRREQQVATTPYMNRLVAAPAKKVDFLTRFGPIYLTPAEREPRLREAERAYYSMLGKAVFESRGKEFWDFHRTMATDLDTGISYPRVAKHALYHVLDTALNPLNTGLRVARYIGSRVERRSRPPAAPAPAPVKAVTR